MSNFVFHGVVPPPPMAPTKTTIKLALEGPNAEKEGPFVKIPVNGPIGNQTLETLRQKSLDLWRATNGSFDDENLDEAKVLLTYRDSEGDLCFVFSEGDLRCAIPMFPTSLKMFAKIELSQKKKKNTEAEIKSEAETKSTQTNNSTASATSSFRDIPVHKVVEALTGVLATANIALQNHAKSARIQAQEQRSAAAAAPEDVAATMDEILRQTVQISNVHDDNQKPAETTETTQPEEDAPEETRLFIHGRHTCDGCLTTPVVGKRFHAANLPDYDLCATCMDNYKGDEVKFEEAEDDRDRPHQERWYRRYNKWTMKNQRQAQKQARKEERCARRWQNRCEGRPRGWNQHPRCFGPPPEKCGPPPDQVDMALKEAIRRSMLDLKQSKKEEKKEPPVDVAPKQDVKLAPAAPVVVADTPKEDTKPAPVEAKAPPAEEEEEFMIPPEAPVGAPPARPAEEVKQPEVAIVPTVIEAKAAPTTEDEDSKPAAASEKTEVSTSSEKTEDSFADDAEGNGEVAEALGETMDAIANAINEISAELETNLTNAMSDSDSKKSEEEAAASKGATILSGEEEVEEKSDDESSQTSWDVVASDEALARAAQVIGSALFESEVNGSAKKNSEESVSMLGSDASIPSNLPSVSSMTSGVAPAQLNRWAAQIKQLHELGFYNDKDSVDIMERLEAANIGSGETDEVSVERVVNELMKNW